MFCGAQVIILQTLIFGLIKQCKWCSMGTNTFNLVVLVPDAIYYSKHDMCCKENNEAIIYCLQMLNQTKKSDSSMWVLSNSTTV